MLREKMDILLEIIGLLKEEHFIQVEEQIRFLEILQKEGNV